LLTRQSDASAFLYAIHAFRLRAANPFNAARIVIILKKSGFVKPYQALTFVLQKGMGRIAK